MRARYGGYLQAYRWGAASVLGRRIAPSDGPAACYKQICSCGVIGTRLSSFACERACLQRLHHLRELLEWILNVAAPRNVAAANCPNLTQSQVLYN